MGRLAILAASLVLVLIACTTPTGQAPPTVASASPQASPSSTPTAMVSPSPSPSPVSATDVLGRLADPHAQLTLSMTGEASIGTDLITMSGVLAVGQLGTYATLVTAHPSGAHLVETLTYGGRAFQRTDPEGPWFVVELPKGRQPGMAATLAGITTLKDAGTALRNDQLVRHFLAPAGTLTPTSMALEDRSVRDFTGTIDIYAGADGSIGEVLVVASWTLVQADGSTRPSSVTLTYVGTTEEAAIAAPGVAWTTFTSKRQRYSIGYPEGAQVLEGSKAVDPDVFGLGDGEFAMVILETQPKGASLEAYVAAYERATQPIWGKPLSSESITIDGRDGRLLTYGPTMDGTKRFVGVALTLAGRDGYQIAVVFNPEYEQVARIVLEWMAGSFRAGS